LSTDTPAVTILLPTFNRLAYLRAALESVERQTFRDFELIVLDDGSSDGTAEFLSRFRPWFKCRIERFERKERAFLRNVGVSMSQAPFIAFLDDDDLWAPQKLERQVAFMTRHPETGMSYTFTSAIDSSGNPDLKTTEQHNRLYRRHAAEEHSFESIARSCLIFTSSVIVRREVFNATGGFGKDYVGSEDWDFYLKAARIAKVDVIPEQLAVYRVHPGNSAAGDRLMKVGQGRMQAALDQLETAEGARARSLLMRAVAQNHYWAGRNAESFRYSLAALRESPATFASPSNLLMLAKSAVKSLK
jgi:glycosyltransferase involved in cell wall biosynthesis